MALLCVLDDKIINSLVISFKALDKADKTMTD